MASWWDWPATTNEWDVPWDLGEFGDWGNLTDWSNLGTFGVGNWGIGDFNVDWGGDFNDFNLGSWDLGAWSDWPEFGEGFRNVGGESLGRPRDIFGSGIISTDELALPLTTASRDVTFAPTRTAFTSVADPEQVFPENDVTRLAAAEEPSLSSRTSVGDVTKPWYASTKPLGSLTGEDLWGTAERPVLAGAAPKTWYDRLLETLVAGGTATGALATAFGSKTKKLSAKEEESLDAEIRALDAEIAYNEALLDLKERELELTEKGLRKEPLIETDPRFSELYDLVVGRETATDVVTPETEALADELAQPLIDDLNDEYERKKNEILVEADAEGYNPSTRLAELDEEYSEELGDIRATALDDATAFYSTSTGRLSDLLASILGVSV